MPTHLQAGCQCFGLPFSCDPDRASTTDWDLCGFATCRCSQVGAGAQPNSFWVRHTSSTNCLLHKNDCSRGSFSFPFHCTAFAVSYLEYGKENSRFHCREINVSSCLKRTIRMKPIPCPVPDSVHIIEWGVMRSDHKCLD